MPQHFLILYVPYRESGNSHYSSRVLKCSLACVAVKTERDYDSVSTAIHLETFQHDLTSTSAFASGHDQLPHTGFLMNLLVCASEVITVTARMCPAENC
jgi:hypothetical protein